MAKSSGTPGSGTGNQIVGKVFILHGTVKAVSPDGAMRVLAPNSPIYANDRIITESDGSVSIVFEGPPPTQLDLGRMSNVLIDEDVFAGAAPEVVADAAAQAEQIQQEALSPLVADCAAQLPSDLRHLNSLRKTSLAKQRQSPHPVASYGHFRGILRRILFERLPGCLQGPRIIPGIVEVAGPAHRELGFAPGSLPIW